MIAHGTGTGLEGGTTAVRGGVAINVVKEKTDQLFSVFETSAPIGT